MACWTSCSFLSATVLLFCSSSMFCPTVLFLSVSQACSAACVASCRTCFCLAISSFVVLRARFAFSVSASHFWMFRVFSSTSFWAVRFSFCANSKASFFSFRFGIAASILVFSVLASAMTGSAFSSCSCALPTASFRLARVFSLSLMADS